jgi:hypothetical protein
MNLSLHGLYSSYFLSDDHILKCQHIFRPNRYKPIPIFLEKFDKTTKTSKIVNTTSSNRCSSSLKNEKSLDSSSSAEDKADLDDEDLYAEIIKEKMCAKENLSRYIKSRASSSSHSDKIGKQDSFDMKVLDLKKKMYDKELRNNLKEMRREKSALTQKYLDIETINYNYLKKRQKLSESSMSTASTGPVSTRASSKSAALANVTLFDSRFLEFQQEQENLSERLRKEFGYTKEKMPRRFKLNTPIGSKPFLEDIKHRFIEQNIKNPPAHQRKRKPFVSLSLYELEKVISK